MGMFDYVVLECPLPDEIAARVHEWQTKNFDWPFMTQYRITAKGRLMREEFHFEDNPDVKPIAAGIPAVRRVQDGWTDMAFHGLLNFYGNADGKWDDEHWVEYNAKFTDGQLVGFERILRECAAPVSSEPTEPSNG